MTAEVLISCMNQKDMSIVKKLGCRTDALIINQTDHDGYQEEIIDGYKIRMFSTAQRGLSRSRNMALLNAQADICLIADDDCHYVKDYEYILIKAFDRHPDADIIAFNYFDENPRSYRNLIEKEKVAPRHKSFSSVALAFRRQSILKNNIFFDLRIGSGSGIIAAGEESAWQYLARQKGLKIYQCPEFITTVSQKVSAWFKGYTENYFYDLGANLSYKYGWMRYMYMLYYPYRLRKDKTIPWYAQMKWMFNGIIGFKKGLGYHQYVNNYGIQK